MEIERILTPSLTHRQVMAINRSQVLQKIERQKCGTLIATMTFWSLRSSGSHWEGPLRKTSQPPSQFEFPVFNHRLRGAARRQLSRLQDGTTSSGIIYALSAFAPAQVRHRE